jgi:hypothetical protein
LWDDGLCHDVPLFSVPGILILYRVQRQDEIHPVVNPIHVRIFLQHQDDSINEVLLLFSRKNTMPGVKLTGLILFSNLMP